MLAQLDVSGYDHMFELESQGTSYLLHVQSTEDTLKLEAEDKQSGDIWEAAYSAEVIEELTNKARCFKKFAVFVRMLHTAITQASLATQGSNSGYLIAELLTYAELCKITKKPMANSRPIDQTQSMQRILILSYLTPLDKFHYPLKMHYVSIPSAERAQVTIRRMAQVIQTHNQDRGSDQSAFRELALTKHQNDLLKARVKTLSVNSVNKNQELKNVQASQFSTAKEQQHLKKIQEQCKTIQALTFKLQSIQKQLSHSQELNEQLSSEKAALKERNANYDSQLSLLSKESSELVSELTHMRETDKKNKIKIANLEAELQKMMNLRYKLPVGTPLSSSRQSEKSLSERSHSQKSLGVKAPPGKTQKNSTHRDKKTIIKQPLQKSNSKPRNSSLYDSDTESSRMRRMNNGRSSPFRQTTGRPATPNRRSPAGKTPVRDRSTSREKIERVRQAGKAQVESRRQGESIVMTQTYGSGSDSDSQTISRTIQLARQRRGAQKDEESRSGFQPSSNLEKRIASISAMLRNAKGK